MTALFAFCVAAVVAILAYVLVRLRSKGRQAFRRERRSEEADADPAVVESRGDSGPPTQHNT